MSLTKVSFSMIQGAVYNILDYGAVGNDSTDCTTAIQAAIDAAFAAGGGTVCIPTGTYKITSSLINKAGVSIIGQGCRSTILKAYNCTAITLGYDNSSLLGPITIQNFQIQGTAALGNIAIYQYSLNLGDWLQGLIIRDMWIQKFSMGISLRNTYQVTIQNNTFIGCQRAVNLQGQCRVTKIVKNNADYAARVDGFPALSGDSYFVSIAGDTFASVYHRPEDCLVQDNWCYEYDYGVICPSALLVWIVNNDFDYTQKIGIQAGGVDAACTISGNWIALDNATTALYGIYLPALGVATTNRTFNISSNQINRQNAITGASVGIYIGAFQTADIQNNTIWDFDLYDIYISGGYEVTVRENISTSTLLSTSIYFVDTKPGVCYCDGNNTVGYIYVHPTSNESRFIIGANDGTYSTQIRGASVIANGTNTVTTTFASLKNPPPNFQNDTISYINPVINILASPSQGLGYLTATCNYQGVTINSQNNATGDQVIFWEVLGWAVCNY